MPNEKLETQNETTLDQDEQNWLEDHLDEEKWSNVKFKIDPKDTRKAEDIIEEKKRMIKALLYGWLVLYNDENNRNYKLKDVVFRRKNNSETEFIVKAYIDPEPSRSGTVQPNLGGSGNGPGNGKAPGGGHLIPAPPPPPDESFG